MTNKSTVAKDYDLSSGDAVIELLAARSEYFVEIFEAYLGKDSIDDELMLILGVILGAQISAESLIQKTNERVQELEAIIEQQSGEILRLGA